jgi:hypothetical protein
LEAVRIKGRLGMKLASHTLAVKKLYSSNQRKDKWRSYKTEAFGNGYIQLAGDHE